MENYKQKYKEALKQAKQELKACGSLDCDAARQIFRLFPELQKSEDERIKTNIIKLLRFVRDTHHQYFDECSKAIEWLKRQDEQGSQEKLALEAVKEEKVDDANKVEPKFKVGDWIISNDNSRLFRRIIEVNKFGYTTDCGYCSHYDKYFHLWTIQDVEKGDVLEFEDHKRMVVGIVSFVNEKTGKVDVSCLLENNRLNIGNFYALDTINPHPATKEQRYFLFQKMKEAGYKWDSNKKELIRYEQ